MKGEGRKSTTLLPLPFVENNIPAEADDDVEQCLDERGREGEMYGWRLLERREREGEGGAVGWGDAGNWICNIYMPGYCHLFGLEEETGRDLGIDSRRRKEREEAGVKRSFWGGKSS